MWRSTDLTFVGIRGGCKRKEKGGGDCQFVVVPHIELSRAEKARRRGGELQTESEDGAEQEDENESEQAHGDRDYSWRGKVRRKGGGNSNLGELNHLHDERVTIFIILFFTNSRTCSICKCEDDVVVIIPSPLTAATGTCSLLLLDTHLNGSFYSHLFEASFNLS